MFYQNFGKKQRNIKMDTNTIKAKLILKAIDKYKKIAPCGSEKTILDCFTHDSGKWIFWFNVGKNTHILCEDDL